MRREGVFETMCLLRGVAVGVCRHAARMARGAEHERLPFSRAAFDEAVARAATVARSDAPHRLRVELSPAGLSWELTPLPALPSRVVLERAPRPARVRPPFVKLAERGALTRLLDRARARGRYDALLVADGRAVETTRANLVVALGGRLVTPPVGDVLLAGTVRGALLDAGALEECPVPLRSLARANDVLLTNALVGVLPADEVRGLWRRSAPSPNADALCRTVAQTSTRPERST